MNRVGIASESNATRKGIRRDASHARTPAPVNPTRPVPTYTLSCSTTPQGGRA